MDSSDPPRPPEPDAAQSEPPALVSVGRRDGWRSAVVVVVLVTVGLAVVISKPWDSERSRPRPGSPAPVSTASGGVAAASATPAPSLPPGPPTFRGLDLGAMGVADGHRDWGVAVAYVSSQQFDDAASRGSSTVTPVVGWELVEPSRPAPGPTLDLPAVTSIAIAATWPNGTRPLAIQLLAFGPSIPRASGPLGPTRPPVRVLDVGQDLAGRLAAAAGPNPGPVISPVSGAFYLASDRMLTEPSAWVGNGWAAGAYAFQLALGGGIVVTLPFTIGGATTP